MLKIIGAGLPRTGTLSLKGALEELGFAPCYHMTELIENPERAPLWDAAIDGQPEWDAVFDGYQATTDYPGSFFWRELVHAYPDAKIILTVRDPHRWYASLRTMRDMMGDQVPPDPETLPMGTSRVAMRTMMRTFTGDGLADEEKAIETFQRHNEEVRRHAPADRLLVYELGQGWEPLCEFLGVEIPRDTTFPHLNDSVYFRDMINRYRETGYMETPSS